MTARTSTGSYLASTGDFAQVIGINGNTIGDEGFLYPDGSYSAVGIPDFENVDPFLPGDGTRPCGRNPWHAFLTGSRIGVYSNHCMPGIREPDMLTGMSEQDWLTNT